MTNKSETVCVPRELLVRLLAVYSSSPWPVWHELARAIEAASAEDARAMVEEPVGYAWIRDLEKVSGRNVVHVGVLMRPTKREGFEPLYRHPHRPVVLPERKGGDALKLRPIGSAAWNACRDAVEELNKC